MARQETEQTEAAQEPEQETANFLIRTVNCFGADPQKRLENPVNVDIYTYSKLHRVLNEFLDVKVKVACPYLATTYFFASDKHYYCQAAKLSQDVSGFNEEVKAAGSQAESEFPTRKEYYNKTNRIKEILSQKFAACYRANPQ